MMGIHQAGHFHVLCRPESWQTRRYPTTWVALHWEGLGEWELYRPALPSPSQSWSNCKSCREAVMQAEETLSRPPWGHSFWRAASTSSQSWISAATTGSLGMSLWLALGYHLRPESLPLASSPSWSFLRSLRYVCVGSRKDEVTLHSGSGLSITYQAPSWSWYSQLQDEYFNTFFQRSFQSLG